MYPTYNPPPLIATAASLADHVRCGSDFHSGKSLTQRDALEWRVDMWAYTETALRRSSVARCNGGFVQRAMGKYRNGNDDGWPKVWAEMSDEELRDRLRHYLFLAATSPLQHPKRIAQLVAEAEKRGKMRKMLPRSTESKWTRNSTCGEAKGERGSPWTKRGTFGRGRQGIWKSEM